ncbi:Intermediate cleaving peptidase 55 [Escovopsis weberi]|uniref:Xaa-Pro aminopeptidase n=1 Tax=Escovopsis weberi TaxID=150374 RepID=A0A0M8N8N6_ESCWE|nr:Intermediate cleaving peptidase 55 [Escovopsis weberi]
MRPSQPPLRRLLSRQQLPSRRARGQSQAHLDSACHASQRQIHTPSRTRRIAPPRQPPLHSASLPSVSRNGHTEAISAAHFKFGQPLHETHPHILNAGELTPGITAQEYADRRAALAAAMPQGAAAVLHAASLQYKSGAVFHPYRQESNFFYLTGWQEPDAVAVVRKTGPARDDYAFAMLVRPKHPREEQWSGYRSGVGAAVDVFNADEAWPIDDAESKLPELLRGASLIYADPPPNHHNQQQSQSQQHLPANALWRFLSAARDARRTALYPVMNRLRALKSPAEIANMRLAGAASGRAITAAMRRPWAREKHLHAFLDHEFAANGCDGPAYIPVVAGGPHASCIHYTANNDVLSPGELVLVDAGGEYGTYITDISRTWPVNGRFAPAQRDLYQAVLAVQRDGVALCREDAGLSLEDIHVRTARALVDQLRALGFDVSMATIDELFPHHVGHYIGLDVHDCPGHSRRELLRSGHCVTIEPGVYVPDNDRWPAHFRGLGVRIEDSVCVEEDSPFVLTTEAVKEVVDIEALRD